MSDSMRLLVFPDDLDVGGTQVAAVTLSRALRDRGHDVVIYSHPGPLLEVAQLHGLPFLERHGHRFVDPLAAARLARIAVRRDVDVVLSFGARCTVEAFLGAHLAARRRLVSVAYPMPTVGLGPYLPSTIPLVVGRADLAVQVQRERRGPVMQIAPPIDCTPIPPDAGARFRERYRIAPDAQVVVMVSRLPEDDRLVGQVDALLDAGVLLAERPRFRLVLVGDGLGRTRVEARARRSDEAAGRPMTTLVGELLDVQQAYSAADVVVGMGTSALRAIAAGKPVVVMAGDGSHELADADAVRRYQRSGAFAGPGARTGSASLARLIGSLLDDPRRASAIANRAAPVVVEHWGAAAVAVAFESFLGALPSNAGIIDGTLDAAVTSWRYARSRAHSLGRRLRRSVEG